MGRRFELEHQTLRWGPLGLSGGALELSSVNTETSRGSASHRISSVFSIGEVENVGIYEYKLKYKTTASA